jgi:hypothetical protein
MPKRIMSAASLENLKMGSVARSQGKVRLELSVLPETKTWLRSGGNASERTDELVRKILKGDLVPRVQVERLQAEVNRLKAELQQVQTSDFTSTSAS